VFGHYSDPFRAYEQIFVANERNHVFQEALDESTLENVYRSAEIVSLKLLLVKCESSFTSAATATIQPKERGERFAP
jgi:hypothetical protein